MLSRRNLLRSSAAASLAMPFVGRHSFAQSDNYPSRDIHAICMFPAGSGADVFVRFYGRKLSERAGGRAVIVENKVGAFGNIATEYVAKSRPDGYTIYIAPGSSVLAAASHLFKKLPFDPINDFEHITTLSKLPFILLVSSNSPYKTLSDLTNDLKLRGDKASYGSVANTGLVGSELYKAYFGLQTVEVKYKENGTLFNDLASGNLAFVHIDPVTASGQLKEGRVRALATTAAERLKSLPDIPSAREAGIMNSDLIGWWSVHAPKGTPTAVLDKLELWFNEIAVAEDTVKFLNNLGSDPFPGDSKTLKDLLVKDTKAWGDYIRVAKIEPLS
jgi:tripartite-type tricarboxylate transporter receptor subunit TctC